MFGRGWLIFVILIHFFAAGAALAAERTVVREVVVSPEGNGARIEIRADQPLVYRSYPMPELAKWVIDLPGARSTSLDDESKQMQTPPLERITVRQKDVNGDLFTRIGLDFSGEVDFSIKEDPVDKGRLVVVLTPSKAIAQKREAAAPALPNLSPGEPMAATGSRQTVLPRPEPVAKVVRSVRITDDLISIEADGRPVFKTLILNKPGRLAIDMEGVSSGLERISVPANRFGIVRCRLGTDAGKLRIVFEVSGDTFPDFQLKEILNGVEIIHAN